MRVSPWFIAGFLLLAQPVAAQDFSRFGLTPDDVKRLTEHSTMRAKALEEAKAHREQTEYLTLRTLMDEATQPIADARELSGRWRCRVTKVGGTLLPVVRYDFFECRIEGRGNEAKYEKLTGSQRNTGTLRRLDGKIFVFRGTGYIAGDKPKPYGSGPKIDEVGLLFRLDPDRLRLEIPTPAYESRYDVVELVRRK